MELSIDILSSYPPVQEAEVDKVLAEEIRDNEKKIVVLDDDPTGVQTVHDISVYTNWEKASIDINEFQRIYSCTDRKST